MKELFERSASLGGRPWSLPIAGRTLECLCWSEPASKF